VKKVMCVQEWRRADIIICLFLLLFGMWVGIAGWLLLTLVGSFPIAFSPVLQ